MPEFPSLSNTERALLAARGIDPERSYWAWRIAISEGDIHPRLIAGIDHAAPTPRMLEAASYLAEGFSLKEAAELMHVSYETVKKYAVRLRVATGEQTTRAAVRALARADVI